MNPAEIMKAVPEVAKIIVPVAAVIPFSAIAKRMLGPAADELAQVWKDQVRLYRYEREIKCVKRAAQMAEEAWFTPSAVPIKILFPLLEGASLEEDETLSEMWAALLANCADSKKVSQARPGFVEILKQLSKDEALLLSGLYDLGRREYERVYETNLLLAESGETPIAAERQGSDPSSRFIDFVLGAGDGSQDKYPYGDIREEVWRSMGNGNRLNRNEPSWAQFTICMDILLMWRLLEVRAGGGLVCTIKGTEFLAMCRAPRRQSSN